MKNGLIDCDGHNFSNLALMRISAYHKSIGDEAEWWQGALLQDFCGDYRAKKTGGHKAC